MSAPDISRIDFFRDLILALIALHFGRLFPTLKSPSADLTGKVAIVTGGNSGIGLQIALELAKQGSTVYLACRNVIKAEEAVSRITSQIPASKGRVQCLLLDTSSLKSVHAFASDWGMLNTKIDLLFHNAGIGSTIAGQEYSTDGFPLIYATNFLGSFLLTYLLETHLSADARIIMTSSAAQYGSAFSPKFSLSSIKADLEPGYHVPVTRSKPSEPASDLAAYIQTKAMQVAFVKLLQNHIDRKAAEAGTQNRRLVFASSPGFTQTPIFAKGRRTGFSENLVAWLSAIVAVDVSQGAATSVWLACTNDDAVVGGGMGGGYWDRMTRTVSSIDMMSKEMVERFWLRWEADAGVKWR